MNSTVKMLGLVMVFLMAIVLVAACDSGDAVPDAVEDVDVEERKVELAKPEVMARRERDDMH